MRMIGSETAFRNAELESRPAPQYLSCFEASARLPDIRLVASGVNFQSSEEHVYLIGAISRSTRCVIHFGGGIFVLNALFGEAFQCAVP